VNAIVERFLPFRAWWGRLDGPTVRADLLAGLVGAIIVLPQGVAFATLAGLPPQYGLYCAMVPTLIAALFGSSHHAVSGPTNAISLVVLATLAPLAEPGSARYIELALTLAFIVGVMMLAMGLLGLGMLVNFISHTVVVAFTTGVGVLIASSQLGNFFGVSLPRGSSFMQLLYGFFSNLADVKPFVVFVALSTLLAGILSQRFVRKVPYMIVAVVAGSLVGYALNTWLGQATTGITVLGPMPSALPPLSYPVFALDTITPLVGIAVAVTALALTESVSVGRSVALKSGQRIDASQEFVGQGLANIGASFFSGYPSCGSFNRSSANYDAGARTPLAAASAAVLLVLIVLAIAPLVAQLPHAAMAALLMMIAWRLVSFAELRDIWRAGKSERLVLGVTLAATLFMNLEFAVLLGVALSLALYLQRTAQPRMVAVVPNPAAPSRKTTEVRDGLAECPQLRMLRVEGALYFGAVSHLERALDTMRAERPEQRHLLLLCKGVSFIDLTASHALAKEAKDRRKAGGGLYFHGLRDPVVDDLRAQGELDAIGTENIFHTKSEAIGSIVPRLDHGVCAGCAARIFLECEGLPGASAHAA
jgi:sulfate permease, SulP family